jgi:hypothetical protein
MKALAAVSLLLPFAACQVSPPAMSHAERARIEAEVAAAGEQLMTAMDNLDVEALSAMYDPSSMHGNDGSVYYPTYDEWVAHVDLLLGSFEELSSEWTSTRVDVLAPDAALFVGQSEARLSSTEPGESREGYVTLVLRNIDGAWKIIHQASVGRWAPIGSEPES